MKLKAESSVTRWLACHIALIAVATTVVLMSGCQQSKQSKYQNYSRKFTDQQWLAMVRQPEHQPVINWVGLGAGRVTETGTSSGNTGPSFKSTPAGVLDHHLAMGLIQRKPLLFLPILDSDDPKLIMTGIYIYKRGTRGSRFGPREQDKAKIEAAFRKLIEHKDARIRSMAINRLGFSYLLTNLLTVDDVRRGLNDGSLFVRVTTAVALGGVVGDAHRYDDNGKLVVGDSSEIEKLVEQKRQLAPVLLEHLNDNHFQIRMVAAREFRAMFRHLVTAESGGTRELLPQTFPPKIDWVRADWHTRDKTKKEWKAWWAEHGEDALRWAHPPQ